MIRKQIFTTFCIGLLATHACFGSEISPPRVEECGLKPHCVSSAAFDFATHDQPRWHIDPFVYDINATQASHAFKILVAILKDKNIMFEETNNSMIKAVAISKLFGYKDDLIFLFSEEKGLIHVRSQSRLGYYDFGKNRRRLEKIRESFISDLNHYK